MAVDRRGHRPVPAEVEAAVYFCCLEALQNAAKHAPDADVEVRLWEESGGLLFSVSDDGPGFDAAQAQRGHGFVNMADRLGAIGGTVRWESEPGQRRRRSGARSRWSDGQGLPERNRPAGRPRRGTGQLAGEDPESRSSQRRRSVSAPSCSLLT